MEQTHFTAWLVNDTSCLDQDCMDITVLQDVLIGGDPDDDGNWATDTGKPQAFYAVTTVNAQDGDAKDGVDQAELLMGQAGWRLTGQWGAVPNAYIATVKKHA
jgi:hypothetical protein